MVVRYFDEKYHNREARYYVVASGNEISQIHTLLDENALV